MKTLEEKIHSLSPDLKMKVDNFLSDILSVAHKKKSKEKIKFKWAGGLENLKEKFTSVELQKQSLDWWVK